MPTNELFEAPHDEVVARPATDIPFLAAAIAPTIAASEVLLNLAESPVGLHGSRDAGASSARTQGYVTCNVYAFGTQVESHEERATRDPVAGRTRGGEAEGVVAARQPNWGGRNAVPGRSGAGLQAAAGGRGPAAGANRGASPHQKRRSKRIARVGKKGASGQSSRTKTKK